ncbi:MAG: class I SAM-dependent methyltransferase [Spirochaetaceae bacterium]|jgi:tRNA (cmo5U34)-methyltransferase|nr:class I SAM-dependent methyltransferase [Spirochaetaceae bacterium]
MNNKSTVDEIRERFDNDVERFSSIDTGQVSTIDAQISLEIITESAKRIVPGANRLLDVGCGAGNYTLKMLSKIQNLECTLLDLSKPMLDKAHERVTPATANVVKTLQSDVRTAQLPEDYFDIILAGAVLHHLRDDNDWEYVFNKLYKLLKNNGCLMISDLVTQDSAVLTNYTWECYENYLNKIAGKEYARKVLAYVEKEDTPRSINYQMELMKKAGFRNIEILHKNVCFAAFAGIK